MRLRVPLRALRLANPVVRLVLRSRAHRAFSGQLLVLTYRGHLSGRAFRIPLRYAELPDGRVVALAVRPERKLWWRSLRAPAPVTLTLRGTPIEAQGALVDGADRHAALAVYVTRHPRSARLAQDAAIVVFARSPG